MESIVSSAHSSAANPYDDLDNNVLNELLAIIVDSKDFFTQAEKLVKDNEINILFKQNASYREETKEYIKNLVVARGGIPVDTGTLTGELRKLYTEFMVLLNDDSLRLLEQMIYHEIRNSELLDLLVDTAQTQFVASLIKEIKNEVTITIRHMKGFSDNR